MKEAVKKLLSEIKDENHPFTTDLDKLSEEQLSKLMELVKDFLKTPW
jgi:hypothetical protein